MIPEDCNKEQEHDPTIAGPEEVSTPRKNYKRIAIMDPKWLSPKQLAELAAVVRGPAPEGDVWIGRTVADWIAAKLGRSVRVQLGWAYLVRLDGKRRKPRPRHVKADPAAQEQFKKTASARAGSGNCLSARAGGTVDHGNSLYANDKNGLAH